MIVTQHLSNNKVFGAPANWDQKDLSCGALPATATEVNGIPCVISFWRPTADELARLNAGQLVALSVIGGVMPPVWVGVQP